MEAQHRAHRGTTPAVELRDGGGSLSIAPAEKPPVPLTEKVLELDCALLFLAVDRSTMYIS